MNAKNAEVNEKIDEMMQLKRTIDFMIPNAFASDPGATAAWNSAAHVEESPKKKAPTP